MIAAELARFFRRQADVVAAKVKGRKAIKGTRHWTVAGVPGTKAIDPANVYDMATWAREFRKAIEPMFVNAVTEAGQAVVDVFVNNETPPKAAAASPPVIVSFDVHDPNVTALIRQRVKQWDAVNKTTADKVSRAIAAGDAAGENIDKIAARVQTAIKGSSNSRAVMIARTETGIAHNSGQLIAARQTGIVAHKTWLAVGDHRTRPSHLDADGQTVGVDETFNVGGSDLDSPGDPNGPAEEVVNCRCVATFDVDENASDSTDEG